mmetsp:Transcript_10116/g.29954  ORF Transcript_10116/g.29954 Transcript_10116/m.29954 type:complete len:211 (+) Transcript_10116:1375-2007(+)
MAVRFFSPPEMPLISALPTMTSAHFARPRVASMSVTRDFTCSELTSFRRSFAANSRTSRGEEVAKSESSCITYPKRCDCLCGSIRLPLILTSPPTEAPLLPPGRTRPARRFMKLVLPAPDGPRMHVSWPGLSSPVMPPRIALDFALKLRSVQESDAAFCASPREKTCACCASLAETLPADEGSTSTSTCAAASTAMVSAIVAGAPNRGGK